MLNFAIDENLGSPEFWRMLDVNEIQVRLSAFPISHENVIAYSMQRIELERHPSLKPIAAKLDMNKNLGSYALPHIP